MLPIKTAVVARGPFLLVMGVVERVWILAIWGVVMIGVGGSIWHTAYGDGPMRSDLERVKRASVIPIR